MVSKKNLKMLKKKKNDILMLGDYYCTFCGEEFIDVNEGLKHVDKKHRLFANLPNITILATGGVSVGLKYRLREFTHAGEF